MSFAQDKNKSNDFFVLSTGDQSFFWRGREAGGLRVCLVQQSHGVLEECKYV